jgi:hypothetical protein
MKFLHLLALFFSVASSANAKKASQSAAVPKARELSSVELALSGSVATVFGVTVMHPVDTIKTLQQSTEGMGLNMIQAGNKILKDGGIGALYSGLGPYVTSDGCAGALKFASYEAIKKWIKDKVPEEQYGSALFVAAAAAFMVSSIALVPGELLKQRLQMGQIQSVSQGVKQIFKNEGILGFYAGYSGVCLRDIPYTMLELGIYDNFKSMYLKFKNRNAVKGQEVKTTQMDEILAAAVSGGITGFLTAPFDNIKTKLMVDVGYKGFFDCVTKTVNSGGISALFAGSAARVAWLLPFTAIYLPVYEIIKRKMEMSPTMPAFSPALAVKGGYISGRREIPAFIEKPDAQPKQSLMMKHTRFAGAACF